MTKELEEICRENGVEVRLTEEFPCPADFLKDVDACFSVGGGWYITQYPRGGDYS